MRRMRRFYLYMVMKYVNQYSYFNRLCEVDKFVCASLHHPHHSEEWWMRLFREASVVDGLGTEESDRYEEAGRLAAGFCSALDEHPTVASWLYQLRSFWRASGAQRLETMRKMAG